MDMAYRHSRLGRSVRDSGRLRCPGASLSEPADTFSHAASHGCRHGLPDVQERMHVQGAQAVGNRPEEFDALIKAEIAKWAKIARRAGVHAE